MSGTDSFTGGYRYEHGICLRTAACRTLFDARLGLSTRLDWFEDRLGEFSLWVSGLKADTLGRSSLDHRVRSRADIREVICDLLDGLCEALEASIEDGTL